MASPPSPKQIRSIENGLNPTNTETIGKQLDLKLTTIDGVLKIVTEELLFKKDVLKGITYFRGQVYRCQRAFQMGEINNYLSKTMIDIVGDKFTVYKVRIPELHPHLPIPSTFNESILDKKIIDLYPDFILDNDAGDPINAGDIVEVTFGNLSNYTDGKIIKKIGAASNAQGSIKPIGASAPNQDSKQKFDDKTDKPITLSNLDEEEVDAYRNGAKIGKIKIKPVQNATTYKAKIEVADQFFKMVEAAKKAGITLMLNDGFRKNEDQQKIYDERYTSGQLNEIGKVKGVAARPGFSKHQNGIAIDIITGGFDTKVYAWLNENAANFGFVNVGKAFSKKKEPWHWEYKGQAAVAEGDAKSTKDVKQAEQKV